MEENKVEIYKHKLPTIEELKQEGALTAHENALIALLNNDPPPNWLKPHPFAKVQNSDGISVPALYIPIENIEYLLIKIYGGYRVEVKSIQLIVNSIVATVRLIVTNPVTGKEETQDGVGAVPIQTKQGAGATDLSQIVGTSIQSGTPAAKTYAIKDAAHQFGKIFGRDINRGGMDYSQMFSPDIPEQIIIEKKQKDLSKLVGLCQDKEMCDNIIAEITLAESQGKNTVELYDKLIAKFDGK